MELLFWEGIEQKMKNKLPMLMADDFANKDLDELLEFLPLPLRDHCRRVAVCSSIIAECAGEFIPHAASAGMALPAVVHTGGTFHDIGKLMIPAAIPAEYDYLLHPGIGAKILEKNEEFLLKNETQAQMILDMVRYHHERPAGNGFPNGLHTKDIPMIAQLCAVANELDHRLYNGQEPASAVFSRIISMEGSYFCESILFCFKKAWPQIVKLYEKWNKKG